MNKINKGMVLIAASIALSAMAQLFMKAGMLEIHGFQSIDISLLWPSFIWISVGLGCYAISMFLWMGALTKYELSFAYPLLSMSYVLVYIGAVSWPRLNEDLSLWKTAGIVFIVIGVFLVLGIKNRV